MTISEALSEGLKVTATGLIIVFSVLIILMLVMMLMKVVFYNPGQKKQTAKAATVPAVSEPDGAEKIGGTNKTMESGFDEGELIAVLTAAVAASLNTSAYNLNIKSYRRIENTSPAWNKAGVRDVIDSRF